ncbi:MAG: DUF3489 domain-containing protein [Pseudomonadota bacterium]
MATKTQSAKQPKSLAGGTGPKSRAKPKTTKPTKKAQLIKMLSAKSGADLQTLGEKLGWQPHTTRAAMSGLRKAGHIVELKPSSNGKPSRYRIMGIAQAEGAK